MDIVGFNMNCADNGNMQGVEENKIAGAWHPEPAVIIPIWIRHRMYTRETYKGLIFNRFAQVQSPWLLSGIILLEINFCFV